MTTAQRAMEIAYSYIDDVRKSSAGAMRDHARIPEFVQEAKQTLSLASRQLSIAADADPTATVYVDAGDGNEGDATQDQLRSEVFRLQGICHYLVGEYKKAAKNLELATRYAPNSPAAYSSLADAYLELGQKQKAREAAKQASELDPDNLEYAKEADRIDQTSTLGLRIGTFRGDVRILLWWIGLGTLPLALTIINEETLSAPLFMASALCWLIAIGYWRWKRG